MTTLTSIINRAFREGGITPVGETPTTDESAEALPLLINLINSLYEDELGEFLVAYNVGNNGITYGPDTDRLVTTVIPLNSRLYCNLSGATTLFLPPTPHNGAMVAIVDASGNFNTFPLTVKGNGRPITGGTQTVLNTANYNQTWIFNEGTGWTTLGTLAAGTDSSPFSTVYDDMLSILLAMRLNPAYTQTSMPEETLASLKRLMKRFRTQFAHAREVSSELGLLYTPSNKYWINKTNFSQGRTY